MKSWPLEIMSNSANTYKCLSPNDCMNMMSMNTPESILIYLLHMFAVLAGFVGFIFLVAYAIKTLSNAKLKMWGMWLLIAGIAACILLCLLSTGFRAHIGGREKSGHAMMMPHGMDMTMDGMNMMLEGKTGDEFDKAFIEMMIPHHQGAIDMANAAATSAKHQEIKNLARAIIASQQREIDQMKQWQTTWGYTK